MELPTSPRPTEAAGAESSIYGNVAGSLGGSANQLLSNQNFQNYIKGGGSSGGINQNYNPGYNPTPGIWQAIPAHSSLAGCSKCPSSSSPQVSPTPNVLFDPLMAGKQQAQTNQLQMQQLDLTAADHEQVGRLAAGLLNIKDPTARAQAYAQGVGVLQSQGLAKYAPPTLPDEGSLRMLVSQTIPAQTQAEWLQNLTANKAYTNAGNTASTSAPGSTTGAAAPATGGPAPFVGANLPQGVTPDEDQLVRTVYGEARGEPVAGQQAVASVIKTRMGLGKQGVQDVVFAPNQFEAWSDPKNRPRMEALSPTDRRSIRRSSTTSCAR